MPPRKKRPPSAQERRIAAKRKPFGPSRGVAKRSITRRAEDDVIMPRTGKPGWADPGYRSRGGRRVAQRTPRGSMPERPAMKVGYRDGRDHTIRREGGRPDGRITKLGDSGARKTLTRRMAETRKRVAPRGYKVVDDGKGGKRATRRLSKPAKRYVAAARNR